MAMAMPPTVMQRSDSAAATLSLSHISGVGSWCGAPGPITAAAMKERVPMHRVPTHNQNTKILSFSFPLLCLIHVLGVLFVAGVTTYPFGIHVALFDFIIAILLQSGPPRLFAALAATIDFLRVKWCRQAIPRSCRDFGERGYGAFGKLTCSRNVSQLNKIFDAPLSFSPGQRVSLSLIQLWAGHITSNMLIAVEREA